MLGSDGNTGDLLVFRNRAQLHPVLDGGIGVRPIHRYGNARADAGIFTGLAGCVRVQGEGDVGIRVHRQPAVGFQVSRFVYQRFAVQRRHLDRHRTANADIALVITGLGLGFDHTSGVRGHADFFDT